MRNATIVSNRITCSVKATVTGLATFQGQMIYKGHVAYATKPVVLSTGIYREWINENIRIAEPLPGGAWSCSFRLAAAQAHVRFTSGGPTGPIVNTAACRAEDTVTNGRPPVCLKDESQAAIPPTQKLYCSAVYPDDAGHQAAIEVDFDHQPLFDPYRFRIPSALWIASAYWHVSAGLQPGNYSCKFSLDGTLITEKDFQVGS